ncbi:Centrosomal protein poc5 [Chytriomyces hyalinus]|nr:Centrosomal protein poc5 [Chytriomyces hyalinus]
MTSQQHANTINLIRFSPSRTSPSRLATKTSYYGSSGTPIQAEKPGLNAPIAAPPRPHSAPTHPDALQLTLTVHSRGRSRTISNSNRGPLKTRSASNACRAVFSPPTAEHPIPTLSAFDLLKDIDFSADDTWLNPFGPSKPSLPTTHLTEQAPTLKKNQVLEQPVNSKPKSAFTPLAMAPRSPSRASPTKPQNADTVFNPLLKLETQQPDRASSRGEKHPISALAQPPAPPEAKQPDVETQPEQEMDIDTTRFHQSLTKWSTLLTRAVLADFMDTKNALQDHHAAAAQETARRYVESCSSLTARVRDLESVLEVFRKKIEARDTLAASAGTWMRTMSEASLRTRFFYAWKSKFEEMRRIHLAERVAAARDRRVSLKRALFGWQRICGVTWRRAVEKTIRVEAERAMQQLSDEYEVKVALLQDQLETAQCRLNQSDADRARAQVDMKKALLRGVCALNMEAMSVFRSGNPYALAAAAGETATTGLEEFLSPINSNLDPAQPNGSRININPVTKGSAHTLAYNTSKIEHDMKMDIAVHESAGSDATTSLLSFSAPGLQVPSKTPIYRTVQSSSLTLPEQPLFKSRPISSPHSSMNNVAHSLTREVKTTVSKSTAEQPESRLAHAVSSNPSTMPRKTNSSAPLRNPSSLAQAGRRKEEPPLVQKVPIGSAGIRSAYGKRSTDDSIKVQVTRHM